MCVVEDVFLSCLHEPTMCVSNIVACSFCRERLNARMTQLIEALEQSLDNSTTMRHVSLRSIRQFVSLLIRLGRGKLVSYHHMHLCSSIQRMVMPFAHCTCWSLYELTRDFDKSSLFLVGL